MKKICFIVQRYGLEVNGGAELHCRQLAELLTDTYNVTVLTTKAVDYMTWKDEYPLDEEIINNVRVVRFSVEKPRDINVFNTINSIFLSGQFTSMEQELEWIEKQGPNVPDLLHYLKNNYSEYDVFIFFTYLYYTTVLGIREVFNKAILIPTAHDEPFLRMKIYNDVFLKPKAIFYNTVEEKELVESKFCNSNIKSLIGGVGVTVPAFVDGEAFKKKYNLKKYMIYVGRIDEGKNCHVMFKYFEHYKKTNKDDIKLVLVGKPVIKIPNRSDIISLGFLSDEDKFNGIAGSELLLLPSEFESLSMVVLEAFALQKPVLVNGKCKVLKGHCQKSNAGLYYENYPEFEATLNYLLNHVDERAVMGMNGKKYVEENYQWSIIAKRFKKLIDYVGGE